tara:strand:+ start:1653 stop:1871 length:219 start_codon:yes stop_codon:yes gene_type:complete
MIELKEDKKTYKRKWWCRFNLMPFGDELFVLDKDADDWLTRLNIPAKYERQEIQTRKYEKPEGSYVNNGRKK